LLFIGRPDKPMISLVKIEQALRRAPALLAIEAEGRIPDGPDQNSFLGRALAGALKSIGTRAEEQPPGRDSALASPEDSKRAIESLIRGRFIESVLIKYSVLNKEV